MRKQLAVVAVLCVATLAACGNKTDANERNFAAAMTEYLNKKGDLCLLEDWPVDLNTLDPRKPKPVPVPVPVPVPAPDSKAGQMAALEAIGLVKGEDTEVDVGNLISNESMGKAKVRRYTLTDAAKPFLKERQMGLRDKTVDTKSELCWGKMVLDKVVKWEGPMKLGDYQEAGVTYTYKIDAAEWATKPEVQASFSVIQILLGRAGTPSSHGVKLTSQGWEARGMD
jgi:hypothetical protein